MLAETVPKSVVSTGSAFMRDERLWSLRISGIILSKFQYLICRRSFPKVPSLLLSSDHLPYKYRAFFRFHLVPIHFAASVHHLHVDSHPSHHPARRSFGCTALYLFDMVRTPNIAEIARANRSRRTVSSYLTYL